MLKRLRCKIDRPVVPKESNMGFEKPSGLWFGCLTAVHYKLTGCFLCCQSWQPVLSRNLTRVLTAKVLLPVSTARITTCQEAASL